MKKLLATTLLLFAIPLLMVGCEDNNNPVVDRAPAAPQGVYTVTGNHLVTVYWNGVYENDIREYIVWRSVSSQSGYQEIAHVAAEDNPNLDLLLYHYNDDLALNGTTFWYAVSAVDEGGHASDLSAEEAYDTPRPDGLVTLYLYQVDSTLAGFNFETAAIVPSYNTLADVYIDMVGGVRYINAVHGSDIQDLGYTSGFDEISVAPTSGWSTLGYLELVPGHTYVVWTAENHFAKIRVQQVYGNGTVSFQWAFQTDAGNPELIAPLQRPVHDANFLQKPTASISQQ